MVRLTLTLLRMANTQRGLVEKSNNLREWVYYSAGFHKYGLMRDDMLRESPEVMEALRRLPQNIRDERNFRIVRAMLTNARHSILPKEEWMTLEKDIPYLQPYYQEVMAEIQEKQEWEKNN